MAWTIAQHPEFWTSAESDFLLYLFGRRRLREAYETAFARPDRGWLCKHQVDIAEFAASVGLGIDELFLDRSGGKRWVDATPSYTLMLDDLKILFPRARFLHIVRDGRAVVSSMIKSGFEAQWARDFPSACRTWAHYAGVAHRFAHAEPTRALEVRNEDLLADPEGVLRRSFEFLGAQFSERAVEFCLSGRINSSYGNTSREDFRRAKDPRTMPTEPWNDWSRSDTRAFWNIAGPAMAEVGYGDPGPWPPGRGEAQEPSLDASASTDRAAGEP